MMKKIALTLITFAFAAHCSATPIVNADAFTSGDNKAILDTETGITWLDFGINNEESINSVVSKLDTTYKGWRLATQSEVKNLWGKLENNDFNDPIDIFRLMGTNVQGRLPLLSSGYFIDDNGYLGRAGFMEVGGPATTPFGSFQYYQNSDVRYSFSEGSGTKYDGSNTGIFGIGVTEISTLLVKDAARVPEPSAIALMLISLLGLGMARRTRQVKPL